MKKLISLLLLFVLFLSMVVPVFAAAVTLTINFSGDISIVKVTQGGTVTAGGSSPNYTYSVDDASQVTISVTPPSGYYSTINSMMQKTAQVSPTAGTVSIALQSFSAPTITLSGNSGGGLAYSITNTAGIAVSSYDVQVYNGGSLMHSFNTTSTSGTILLSGATIVAGTSYTAKAKANSAGGESAYGASSAAATASAEPKSYTLSAKTTEGGKINSLAGSYPTGSEITITATADTGYKFAGWTSSGGGTFGDETKAETTFKMPESNVTLTATFKKAYNFVISRTSGGTVFDTDGIYYEGEKISLQANPAEGYKFDKWVSSNGGTIADSTSTRTTFTMPASDVTVTGSFIATDDNKPGDGENLDDERELFTLTAADAEGGTVVVNQSQCYEGQKVTVRANAKEGYVFKGWSSEGGGSFEDASAVSTTFTMPAGDVTIKAAFAVGSALPGDDDGEGDGDKDGDDKKGGGIVWVIIAIVGAAAAITVGVLLILRERRRRMEDDEFIYDDDDNDGYGGGYDTIDDIPQYNTQTFDLKTEEFRPVRDDQYEAPAQDYEQYDDGQYDEPEYYDEAPQQPAKRNPRGNRSRRPGGGRAKGKPPAPDNIFRGNDGWDD